MEEEDKEEMADVVVVTKGVVGVVVTTTGVVGVVVVTFTIHCYKSLSSFLFLVNISYCSRRI